MKKISVVFLLLAAFTTGAMAQTKWNVDKVHSAVKFSVTHMMVAETEGSFKVFDGSVDSKKEDDFSDAKINFTVDVNSINTDNERRDGHLKSDDFFNAAQFPTMKFEGTSMKSLGGNKYELKGNLTIRDVTKPATFQVTYGGLLKTSRGTKAGFKATTTINRFDYKLKFDAKTETGGLIVGQDVEIVVKVELDKAAS